VRIHTSTTIDIETGQVLSDFFYEYSGPLALCDRAAKAQARQAEKIAGQTAAGYGSQATGINNTLVPTLTQEATNPTGFTPTQLNNQLVAGEQGAGGATSGITGTAGLNAMRTRNSGALSSVYDQAARRQGQTLSQNAVTVQNQNAMLQEKKRQEGLAALQGLYGTDVKAQLAAMGIQDQDINTEIKAGQSGWFQNALGLGELGVKAYGASQGVSA